MLRFIKRHKILAACGPAQAYWQEAVHLHHGAMQAFFPVAISPTTDYMGQWSCYLSDGPTRAYRPDSMAQKAGPNDISSWQLWAILNPWKLKGLMQQQLYI